MSCLTLCQKWPEDEQTVFVCRAARWPRRGPDSESAKSEHVDFHTDRLILPTIKTGRRVHDLPGPALEVMSALPRINPWVFTVGRDVPVTYRHVRTVFAEAAKATGFADVRLHDLRRAVMTRAAASGIGAHVLRDLLDHKTTAMTDRYIRALSDPVREARQRVGAEIAR